MTFQGILQTSDLVKSWGGGGVWRSHAEYFWCVVYYWVRCVIVHVGRSARLIYDVVSTATYKGREDLV